LAALALIPAVHWDAPIAFAPVTKVSLLS
jgi:hypothetical protein